MSVFVKAAIIYAIVMNIAGFLCMYVDKQKAVKHQWRIPEKTLFFIAILGGSIGCLLGMRICRHKTKHWYFVAGMPAILTLQIAAAVYLYVIQR